jgi:autotransporter-associated beta strand protein
LTTTGGNGTTILTGANSYNGATTIGTGTTLQVGNGGTTGTVGTAAITNNGTLRFARTGSYSSTNNVSGSGGVEVINGGTLTFGGTNTYNGSTSVKNGTLRLSVATALSASTSLVLGDTGTVGTLDLNGINATVGGISTAGTAASQVITNNSATTNATLTVSLAGNSTYSGQLRNGPARSLGLAINGGGTLTLDGSLNNYSLGTTVTNGTAKLGANNAFGAGGITLGGTGTVGVLDLNGFNQTVTALAVGAGATAASQLIGNGGSGTSTLEFAASGASTFAGTIQDNFGGAGVTALTVTSNSLTLTGGASYSGATSIAAAGTLVMQQASNQDFNSNLSGSGIFTQNGAAILTLKGTNSMTGTTRITGGGTLKADVANALSASSMMVIGNGTAAGGNLDLGSTSQSILGMTINPNATTANTNTITIASGKKLTVNGTLSIDSNTDNAVTTVNMTGGGELEVNGTNFIVGNNTTGTNNSSRATLDMSGLSAFTASLTGTFAVMLTGDNDTSHASTVVFSNTANTVTAGTFGVGVSGAGGLQVLTLGAGTNAINANTFNFGTGGRDSATVSFGGNSTGSITIRNAAGDGRAAMNIGTGSATTGAASTNTIDFAGHSADLLLSTFTLGNQFRNGAQTNTFTFDQGTFDATTVRVGLLPAAGGTQASVTLSSTLNWNGGTVVIGNGGLELANSVAGNTATAKTVNAVVNINGASVSIANNPALGGAIRLFHNTGASTINNISGLINITAGSLTVAGDIVRGTAATGGTHTGTLRLNGGVLNMGGNSIGSGTLAVSFEAQSGTLSNLNELNGGAALDKTTSGTLNLNTANSYAGATTVSAGVLAISHASALGGTASGTTVASGAALQISGGITTVAETLILNGSGISSAGALRNTSGSNNYTGAITLGSATRINSDAGTLTLSGGITGAQDLTFGGSGSTNVSSIIGNGTGALTKDGGGSLILSAANTYTGATAVNAGKLFVNGSLDAASAVTVAGGATLGGSGSIPGAVTVNNGGIIEPGHLGAGTLTIGTLNLGAVATDTSIINLSNIATGTPGILDLTTLNVITDPSTITINISNATAVATGTYKLIDYTGTALTESQRLAFVIGTTTGFNSRQVLSLFNNTALTQIELTMTGDAPKWTGFDMTTSSNSSVWDPGNATLLNWQLIAGGTPTYYQSGDQVLFDDSATGSYTVTISSGNVDPASVVFNNSNGVGKTYTLEGSNGITGTTGLTKNNTGTLIINNANSFTGGVVINNGIIQLGNAGALGTGNLLTFGAGTPAGTKLQLNGNNATVTGLVSAGTDAVVENGTAGNATLTVALASGSNTFAGVLQDGIAGTLGLSQTGAGTLILTGTNNYTGGTSVGAGSTLQVGAGGAGGSIVGNATVNGTLRFNRTGTVAYGGTVGGTGSLSIVAGTLEFTGTVNNTLAGTSISSGATLQIGNGTLGGTVSSNIANAGTLVVNLPAAGNTILSGNITGTGALTTTGGNGTTILTGANSYNGATTIGAGTTLQVGNGGTTGALGTGTVTVDGTLRFSRSDALIVSAPLAGAGGVNIAVGNVTFTGGNTYTSTTTIDSGATLTIGLGGVLGIVVGDIQVNGSVVFNRGDAITYSGLISGTGTVTKSGNGVTTFTNTNTYSGSTTINGGTLSISSGNNIGDNSATNTLILASGGSLQSTAASLTLGVNRSITLGTGGGVLDVTGANSLDVTGVISGTSLTKTGTGVLTLSAANTHSGGTTLSAGTLNITQAAAIGSGLFTIAGGTIDVTGGSAVTLANNAQAWNGDFTFTGTNDLNLGSGAVNLSANRAVTVSGGTLTVGGVIDDGAGNFTFTKNGAGTLYLAGVNTFGSNTAINIAGGVLKIDAESGLGTNTNDVTFTGNGTLQVTTGFTANTGKVFAFGTNTGTLQVDSGTLVIGSAVTAGTAGIFVKAGAGTVQLTVASTALDGTARLDAGTLSLRGNSANVLGDTTNRVQLRFNGGNLSIEDDTARALNNATFLDASGTITLDRVIAGAGVIHTMSGAALTVASSNPTLTINAGSNINAGTAGLTFGATTLNGNATFNINDPAAVGTTTLLTLGAVTGGSNSITLTGNGDFAQTGAFASTAATSLTLNSGYSGLATLSQTNTYTGATTINGGTLAFSTSANLGDATQATNSISINGGTLSYTGAGSLDIGANRVITVGSSGATLNATGAAGILTVSGGLSSTGNLTKTGIGSIIVSGTTSLNSGTGSVTVSGGLLAAGFGAGGVDNITVAAGAALYNTDSSATTLLLPTTGSLTLTAGSSLATASKLGFGMNLSSAAAISLDATTPLTINSTSPGDTIYIDLVSLGTLLTEKDYDLIIDTATIGRLLTGTGGAVTYALDNVIGGYVYTLNATANLVKVNVSSFSDSLYWRGDVDNSWTTYNAANTNWTNALTGGADSGVTPGSQTTVVFSATEATGPSISTTLDGNVTIKNLQFTSNPSGVTAVSIGSGTFGSLTIGNAIGIDVAANAGVITISAPVVLGASQTWAVDGTGGASLTVSGGVGGTAGLTILGTNSGIVTLSGTNLATYNGATIVGSATAGSGLLQAGAATSFSAASAHTINAGGTLRLNGFNNTIGSLAGAGTVDNNTATNATLTTGGDNTSTTFSGTLANGSTGTLGLTKVGTGRLTLTGSNSYTGTTTVTAGYLSIQGTTNTGAGTTTLGNAASARARLEISTGGAFTTTDLFTGGNATGAGAVYQSAGSVTTSAADGTNRGLVLGQTSTGYGFYSHSGGTLTTARITYGANGQTGGTGVFRLSGGTATVNTWNVLAHGPNSNAMLDIVSGTMTSNTNFAANHSSGGYSLINVRGGQLTVNTTTQINRGNNSTSNNTGILTLSGGILATNTVSSSPTQTPTGGNISVVNFNGGTLRALQANATFVNINTTGHDVARTGAFVHSGGATIDSNGFAITIASSLQAPSGVGVQSIAVTDGGSGYIGPPIIKITGGSGSGAVAIANMEDDGTGNGTFKIGSITILSPGSGYLNTDVLTVTAAGGGASSAATLGTLAFNLTQNSGGLTKIGAGTLTLGGTAANTYTGTTVINAGQLDLAKTAGVNAIAGYITIGDASGSDVLKLQASNQIADTSVVTLNGTVTNERGVFRLNGYSETIGGLSGDGVVEHNDTDTGVGSSSSSIILDVTSGSQTYNGVIRNTGSTSTGTLALTKSGAGTQVLTGTNAYTGKTTITGGKLSISDENNLGANPGSSTADQLTLAGGTLLTTATFAIDDANRGITVGTGGGTFETSASTTLTVNSAITGSGAITKEGTGALILNAVNTSTGATTVNAGTLQVGVSGAGSTHASSTVTLNGSSAVLAGSGTVNGSVVVTAGQINPGDSAGAAIGTLTVGGDVTLTGAGTPASRLTLQLAATSASSINDAAGIQAAQAGGTLTAYLASKASDYELESGTHDKLTLTGALNLNAGGRITLDNTLGYSFAFGDVFDMIDWGSVNLDADGAGGFGAFDSASDLLLPSLGSGLDFDRSLFATNGIIVVVPEPSRALFLMFGLLGLMLRRRRR